MASTTTILLVIGIAALSFILYHLLMETISRAGVVYISNKDLQKMTGSVNTKIETGGTIDQKPSHGIAHVTLEKTGTTIGGRPAIIIRQERDDEAVWHSHPDFKNPYVNKRNSVPSPEDIAVMLKTNNSADLLVTPDRKVLRYGKTDQTQEKLRFTEKVDPTGLLVTRRLRNTMKDLEKQNPKYTVKDAKTINEQWKSELKSDFGVELKPVQSTKKGVVLKDMDIKEE